jgi:beta-barrel assembly-enhancing protease
MKMSPRALFVCVLTTCFVASCYAGDPFKPSPNQQAQLGQRAAADLKKKEKVLPETDPRVVMVRKVGNHLLSTFKDDKPWKFSFDVIASKEVNAFALPGGPTFVYTGLLEKLKTQDELAGVLGHELTHVRREHWAYGYRDEQKRSLGLAALLIFTHANRSTADIASIGNDVIFNLPFSRKHESEADNGGIRMMVDAGYNPQGIVDVFKILASLSGKGAPPEFLSDHPSDAKRIKAMQDNVDKLNKTFDPQRPLPENVTAPFPIEKKSEATKN